MKKLLFLLCLCFPILLRAANPGFQDFRGSNGILTSVTGTGGSQKLVIGFKNGSSNFLANTAGVLVNNGAGLLSWAAVSQTNLFNSDQFAVGDGIVSIKDGALTTNLDVFNLLLGNANVYTDDGSNFLRNGVPIGGNQTITTNLTVVNESIFQGDTTFEGVNDFSGTSNIFNGPVYFNSNFVFNGILITNIGQVNSANYMPVSTGTNFVDSPIIVTNSTIATVLGSVLAESLRFTNGYRLTNSASAFSRIDLIHDGAPGGNFSIGGSAGVLNIGGGLSSSITAISNLDIIHNGYTWRYTDDGFNPIFRPTSSNTHDIASALFPLRAIYVGTNSLHFIGPGFDSKLRSDADTLYLNDVPVGIGPWTDDGTNTFLTDNPNAFKITDATGDTSIGIDTNSLLTLSASSSYQIVAMNWTDGTNTQAVFMQLQDTNVAPVSSFEVDVGATPLVTLFPFTPDGANEIAYMFDTANVLGTPGALLAAFRHSGTNVATIWPDGTASLSGTTNLIGDNGSGITWNGVPVGGGDSLWSSNNGAIFPTTQSTVVRTDQRTSPNGKTNLIYDYSNIVGFQGYVSGPGNILTNGQMAAGIFNAESKAKTQFGVIGDAQAQVNGQTNVAVTGTANDYGNSGVFVGGYFERYTITTSTPIDPVFENAVVVLDARNTDVPLLVGRTNNGDRVFALNNDGSISPSGQTNRLSSDGTNPLWDGVPLTSLWTFDSGTLYSDSILTNGGGTLQLGMSVLAFTNNGVSFDIFSDNGIGTFTSGGNFYFQANTGTPTFLAADGASPLAYFANTTATNFTIWPNGDLSISGMTNLLGMSAGGQLTVDGVPVGGGSSPWSSDDAYAFLTINTNVIHVDLTNGTVLVGTNAVAKQTTFLGGPLPGSILFAFQDTDLGDADFYDLTIGSGSLVGNFSKMQFGGTSAGASLNIHVTGMGNANFGATAGGSVLYGEVQDNPAFNFQPGVGTGAGVIAYTLDTGLNAFSTGAKLLSVKNAGVEKFYLDFAGKVGMPDTNGLGGFITMTVSTNSGSAVATFTGSPPSATVPIGNDGKYDFANGITVGGTNAFNGDVTVGLVTLSFRNGLLFAHSP